MALNFSPLTQTHPTVSVDQKPGLCLVWSLNSLIEVSALQQSTQDFLKVIFFPGSLSCWQGLVPYGLLS